MADIPNLIQEREQRFLASWMRRDTGDLKKLVSRDCVLVFGTTPLEVLDRASFVSAAERDFRCLGFRGGEGVARRYGNTAWYAGAAELELKLGMRAWQDRFMITGLWQKFTFGGWKLVERGLSPVSDQQALADSVRRLQMWR